MHREYGRANILPGFLRQKQEALLKGAKKFSIQICSIGILQITFLLKQKTTAFKQWLIIFLI